MFRQFFGVILQFCLEFEVAFGCVTAFARARNRTYRDFAALLTHQNLR